MIFNLSKLHLFTCYIKDFDEYFKFNMCVKGGIFPSIKDTFTTLKINKVDFMIIINTLTI